MLLLREKKVKSSALLVDEVVVGGIGSLVDSHRYSKLSKLLSVSAIDNIRKGAAKKTGALHLTEIKEAEKLWLQYEHSFIKNNADFKKKKTSLRLFEDQDGLLRSRTRISGVESIQFKRRQPILLRKNSYFTELIILQAHQEVCHLGVESTLNHIRASYWLIRGRQTVKKLLRDCVTCRRVQGKPLPSPNENELPAYRVQCEFAFENTGLDFAGPLYCTDVFGSDGTLRKCYILLFTCATTRGVHLELTPDQSVPTLILALKRFVSRRGHCKLYISDNFKSFKSNELQNLMRANHIDWEFILEKAPWWGGFYERCVKTVKDAIKKVIGTARLNFDELRTALTEVENAVNSRPLTYVTAENDQDVLTPYHLMFGRNINAARFYAEAFCEPCSDISARTKHVRTVINHFVKRFENEYITNLKEFHKNRKTNGRPSDIDIDDVVLIKEDKPRMQWKKGHVLNLIKGTDDVTRGAEVLTKLGQSNSFRKTVLKRPVQKVIPLEVSRPRRQAALNGELIRRLTTN